jgi:hypothetical protein
MSAFDNQFAQVTAGPVLLFQEFDELVLADLPCLYELLAKLLLDSLSS